MNEKELLNKMRKIAEKKRFKLNPNKKALKALIGALIKKKEMEGEYYCPCRMTTGNKEVDSRIICPCVYCDDEVEEQGHCHCMLFFKN